LDGHKFRRQFPLGPYIVDFVCLEAKLVIEVDGGQHNESQSDRIRDNWLAKQGFRVLRFWNNEVLQNTDSVLAVVYDTLHPHLQVRSQSGASSPSTGEGRDGGEQ
jgi:very-short-patch-repair endonuclease